jgi:hypothetical protein
VEYGRVRGDADPILENRSAPIRAGDPPGEVGISIRSAGYGPPTQAWMNIGLLPPG